MILYMIYVLTTELVWWSLAFYSFYDRKVVKNTSVLTKLLRETMANFPSKCELKCAGLAMIVSQILFAFAFGMHAIDYDSYAVDSEDEALNYNILSSERHRTEIRIACACIWCAFPLMIISLYGVKKFQLAIFDGSSAEMAIYVLEKAYIIFIGAACIFIPALR